MSSLKDELRARNRFIQLEVGEEFTGIFKGHRFVLSDRFVDDEGNPREIAELTFEVDGRDKTIGGSALAQAVAEFNEGDTLRVKKLTQKGNKITWLVEKAAVQQKSAAETVKDEEATIDPKDIPF